MSVFPSEFRHDRISGRWVVVAIDRAKRPHSFAAAPAVKNKRDPFIPDNIPPTDITGQVKNDGVTYSVDSSWKTIAIKNAFPFVTPGDGTEPHLSGRERDGYGFHEIVVHSPDKDRDFADFETAQTEAVISLILERFRWLAMQPHIEHVQIFTNRGQEAGASVVHPHSQIVALPLVPPYVEHIVSAAARHYASHDEAVIDHVIEREQRENTRIVIDNEQFLVYCPYASRADYHIRLVPKLGGNFRDIKADMVTDLARLINDVFRRYRAIGIPSYNMHIRTAPIHADGLDGFRWYIDVLPHVSTPGGLELSTGLYVITTLPEDAATAFRDAVTG